MATPEDVEERDDGAEADGESTTEPALDSSPAETDDASPAETDSTRDSSASDVGPDSSTADADGGDTGTETTGTDRYTRKKCVLITGCSSGIGRAAAEAFLDAEWTVVATARNTDDIAALAEAGCVTRELDVTKPEQVARAVERTVEVGGAIDCLVNNAGYAQMGPLEDVSIADLHRQFDVNVYGPHRLARAALPHMRAQGSGRIINVSSVLGRLTLPTTGAYSGSKFALEAMSDALRAEVEEFGIDVVLIEPGTVETAFADRASAELPHERTADYEALYEIYDDAQLIGRSEGPFTVSPAAVARAILEAATAVEPPARYPVGPMAEYGLFARFLPDGVRDGLYRLVKKFV
ncbi:SDR family oxidoreductase [Natronobiforma cellulositropha]|uniref:SDR family oxidoreductase n=1 Tax=Natronobiforma cellulositropha TaxID=1679076 RepID=UPI0021D59C4E|nr:SDR family oxidoreductase [Natronobiforma cellulositropha]